MAAAAWGQRRPGLWAPPSVPWASAGHFQEGQGAGGKYVESGAGRGVSRQPRGRTRRTEPGGRGSRGKWTRGWGLLLTPREGVGVRKAPRPAAGLQLERKGGWLCQALRALAPPYPSSSPSRVTSKPAAQLLASLGFHGSTFHGVRDRSCSRPDPEPSPLTKAGEAGTCPLILPFQGPPPAGRLGGCSWVSREAGCGECTLGQVWGRAAWPAHWRTRILWGIKGPPTTGPHGLPP